MTSGRLKDLLSRVRQGDATRDATRDKGMSAAVASPGKNDPQCDTRATSFSAEDLDDIKGIETRDTVLSHVASPRAGDTRQTHTRPPLSPAALADLPPEDANYPWWRVSIVGPRALNIELEMRSAWTVSHWGRFARRHYGPDATVVVRARPEPEPVTEEGAAEDLKEFLEERSSILEHDAGLPRPEAEIEAARITATYARNRGYLWASLRAALAGYPLLLSQVPDRPGPIDSLPFGTARVHVREDAKPRPVSRSIVITDAEIEAARKGRTVVRQGAFTGAQEVAHDRTTKNPRQGREESYRDSRAERSSWAPRPLRPGVLVRQPPKR